MCVCPYMHASVCMLICCTRFWHATALRKMQLASSYSGRHLFVQRLSSFLLLYGMRAKAILAITETQPLQKQSLLSQRRRDPCFAACKSNPCYHREAEILAFAACKSNPCYHREAAAAYIFAFFTITSNLPCPPGQICLM